MATPRGRSKLSRAIKSEVYNDRFSKCAGQLRSSVYSASEDFCQHVGDILDELASLDFTDPTVARSEETVADLVQMCCHKVPLNNGRLVSKLCEFILNIFNQQQILLVSHVDIVLEYLFKAINQHSSSVQIDVCRALATVVYSNASRTEKFHNHLLGEQGILLDLLDSDKPDLRRAVVQCIGNICIRGDEKDVYLSTEYQTSCGRALLSVLQRPVFVHNFDESIVNKTIVSALKGVQNLLEASKSALNNDLIGPLLAALQAYMFYGLETAPSAIPSSLNSLPLNESNFPFPAGTPAQKNTETTPSSSQKQQSAKSRRKGRGSTEAKSDDVEDHLVADCEQLGIHGSRQTDVDGVWSLLYSSESDVSDTEQRSAPTTPTSVSRRHRSGGLRIRLHALSCFNAFVKFADRRLVYSYWASFIPDTPDTSGNPSSKHTLLDVIVKDPSPKVRAAALSVLSVLLEGSKPFLSAAEESEQYRVAPFTSYSVVVGQMVKEMHRRLLLMLASETSSVVTTQLLKSLSKLIAGVPYHRLRPGLLSYAVKQIRPFLSHRDPIIRVASLTCLGSVVSTPNPLLEVSHIIEPVRPSHRSSEMSGSSALVDPSPGGLALNIPNAVDGFTPNTVVTPTLSSGAQTPSVAAATEADSSVQSSSWLIRACIRFIAPQLNVDVDASRSLSLSSSTASGFGVQPLPVQLEALQLLTVLTKNYFNVARKSIPQIKELVVVCLVDTEPSVQLHAAKLLEVVGSALAQLHRDTPASTSSTDLSQAGDLWLGALTGPLPHTLQHTESSSIRSALCDCLAAVGAQIFSQLPLGTRTMCVTLVLGLASDVDSHVRSAAIRALGCYILYPCLREDVSFVTDVSNILLESASEPTLAVRSQVSWSLGNLGDALVLNRSESNEEFMQDFSSSLLCKLLKTSIQLCTDNDKSRANAVRAVGNILRYIPPHVYESGELTKEISSAIQTIVKNITSGSVKVRWNGCYATANLFGNETVFPSLLPRLGEVFSALISTARTSKNFKVRISAATAMAAPETRDLYGSASIFASLWSSQVDVLQSLDHSDADFVEYKYKDNLINQVCATLIHMAALIAVDDLPELSRIVSDTASFSVLSDHLQKYFQAGGEQQSTRGNAVSTATSHVKSLASSPETLADPALLSTVSQLCQLFSVVLPDDTTATGMGLVSGFRQMYD